MSEGPLRLADLADATLPTRLSRKERLELLALLFGTAMIDGELDAREAEVLSAAARRMDVPYEDVIAALR